MTTPEYLFELRPEAIPGLLAGVLVAIEEARQLQALADSRMLYAEGVLRAVRASQAQEPPSEPPSPLGGHTEAYPGVLGAQEGDKLDLRTMGSGG